MAFLMYFDTEVLSFTGTAEAPAGIKVSAPELLPFYLRNDCSVERFKTWIQRRRIPDSREGIADLRKRFKNAFTQKSYASLSDPYWIRYRFEKWSGVNYFTRIYAPDIGDLVFKPYEADLNVSKPDLSPDLTTIGVLRKCWRQYNGNTESYLIKAGSVKYHHEPLSEVLSSVILEKLKLLPSVKYDLAVEGIEMCSKCRNFIEPGQELVTAVDFYNDEKRGDDETIYEHLIKMMQKNNIPHARDFIDKMTFIDMLLGNTDRNLSNIGFIRDIKTGELKPAPLYDNGTAFFGDNNIKKKALHFEEEKKIFKRVVKDANIKAVVKDKSYADIIKNYPGLDKEMAEQVSENMGQEFREIWNGKKERALELEEQQR